MNDLAQPPLVPTRPALSGNGQPATDRRLMIADLMVLVERDPGLDPRRKRDLLSALRQVCKRAGTLPTAVEASPEGLRRVLKAVHPTVGGPSRRTLQNQRANVSFALKRYGDMRDGSVVGTLSSGWRVLWERLPEGELRFGLSRLIRYCSQAGIGPGAVDDGVLAGFGQWLNDRTLVARPSELWRRNVRLWNRACKEIEGWPSRPLTLPTNRETYCLRWEQLPSAFRDDVEAYLARLAGSDPLDIDGPAHPARASTLKTRRFQFLQLTSALAHRGYPVEQLRSLRDLTDIEAVRLTLHYFIDRAKGARTSQVAGLAALLYSVAAHWCKRPEAELELLRRFRRNLQPTTHGLTAKNRERLRQFTDKHNIIALLGLPPRMFEAILRKQTMDRTDLADLQVALVLELLLMAPIRRANVVGLRIGPRGHIKPRQDRKGTTHIVIGANEVKNHRPLEYPVPAETARLIELYVAGVLPLISDHPGDWLFPGERPGQHRSFDAFSNQFTRTIRRWTGLTVNLHLMRHIGAKLFLDRNPGAYEVVRHVLGHSQRSTALDHYTGLETEAALRHYDRVILGIREEISREIAQ